MTTEEKCQLWSMCLDSVSRKQASPATADDVEVALTEAKKAAEKVFREILSEVGEGMPDWNGIRERL